MLDLLGVDTLDDLISQTIPSGIRLTSPLKLPDPLNEFQYLRRMKEIASLNRSYLTFIGQGYYGTIVPAVIQRNILENPGWYTAYTPYQAEIAQGRLEALINFQTMILELTGMEIANASLLDEGTAAAEAATMLYAQRPKEKKDADTFLVDEKVFPQTLAVLRTRAGSLGINLRVKAIDPHDFSDPSVFGVFFQFPDDDGTVSDRSELVRTAKDHLVAVAVSCDLLSLCLFSPPGEWGADVVVGSSQRFGVPVGYGGPHAAFLATREAYKRAVPGRIIGLSRDAAGDPAYRMALQTREQHIKRERATSNICTAQVLLAVVASMYAVYHGPQGLKKIALRVHGLAKVTAEALTKLGVEVNPGVFFDTLKVSVDGKRLRPLAEEAEVNFRYFEDGTVGISFDETHSPADAEKVVKIIAALGSSGAPAIQTVTSLDLPASLARTSDFLSQDVFNQYRTEHELLRYMKRLENKDLSLVHSMISLGSCTMKLNATTEMIPITWPEFNALHPFAPAEQTRGYDALIRDLTTWLAEITGFAAISLQPNSGAQGEYAGLMAIRSYHMARGDHHRTVVLIPSSAHGTNPASAVMAGLKVVIVRCDEKGNIDVEDLKQKAEVHAANLSALMVTYPSTHGVFEEAIVEVCEVIHRYGGQVYMDGANMNAQVGLTSPALIGADVCHLNLHKTFCIPHGGGGPGMGPIGVAAHLASYLPATTPSDQGIQISAAPYGSGSILPISHAYIAMMGGEGLRQATQLAILNANYIAYRLKAHYPILYANHNGRNAHELIIDCRDFKKAGIEVEDLAKRMMDYGYHAPTVSFPVPGTMMIEPTESETKRELDRFCEVMIAIRKEIEEVAAGVYDKEDNPLKNAPHTQKQVISDHWTHPYSREKAAFPLSHLKENKFWPSVARIDSAYGDRNLVCTCVSPEEYEEMEKRALIADL